LSSDVLAVNSPPPTVMPTHIAPSVSGSALRPNPSGGLNPNAGTSIRTEVKSDAFPSDSDYRLERIWADYERSEMDVKVEYIPSMISTSRPFQVSLYI
jgi:phosphoinositide-3-kinase, regulatory subunit 4